MMNALLLTVFTPLIGAVALGLLRPLNWTAWLNIAISGLTFALAIWLAGSVTAAEEIAEFSFRVDAFNVTLVVLTAFVGLTTSIFSRTYMQQVYAAEKTHARGMRIYHAMYQLFMFTLLLALTTDNLGILWVAIEGATLTTVLLVSLYRTPEAIEAAWKYFILCGVGIALALFGTVLIYFAAQHVLAEPETGLTWSVLYRHAGDLNPAVMSLAFVFLLVGYGVKVGLAPMHQWLPDAHSECPAPLSALLSGLLLNVALYAIVRLKMLVDGALAGTESAQLPGYLLMGFGLFSFLVAALFMQRQRNIKRLFSYSSIEHMGLMTFAFGLGGPLATFGALLHMLVHSLTKSAIFVTVGHATHIAGTQSIDHIRGLIRAQPAVGWSLLIGAVAIAGFPPFGVFTSKFLLLNATLSSYPWLAALLLIGLGIAFAGVFRHLQAMVYGTAPEGRQSTRVNMLPVFAHLCLVLWLGLSIPEFLANWLNNATLLITGVQAP